MKIAATAATTANANTAHRSPRDNLASRSRASYSRGQLPVHRATEREESIASRFKDSKACSRRSTFKHHRRSGSYKLRMRDAMDKTHKAARARFLQTFRRRTKRVQFDESRNDIVTIPNMFALLKSSRSAESRLVDKAIEDGATRHTLRGVVLEHFYAEQLDELQQSNQRHEQEQEHRVEEDVDAPQEPPAEEDMDAAQVFEEEPLAEEDVDAAEDVNAAQVYEEEPPAEVEEPVVEEEVHFDAQEDPIDTPEEPVIVASTTMPRWEKDLESNLGKYWELPEGGTRRVRKQTSFFTPS